MLVHKPQHIRSTRVQKPWLYAWLLTMFSRDDSWLKTIIDEMRFGLHTIAKHNAGKPSSILVSHLQLVSCQPVWLHFVFFLYFVLQLAGTITLYNLCTSYSGRHDFTHTLKCSWDKNWGSKEYYHTFKMSASIVLRPTIRDSRVMATQPRKHVQSSRQTARENQSNSRHPIPP